MSFILDALKKSENARQRQAGPALFEVKVAPPRRAVPLWAIAIGLLLLVNGITLSWILLRHHASAPRARIEPAPIAASTAPAAATPPAAASSTAMSPASTPGPVTTEASAPAGAGTAPPVTSSASMPLAPGAAADSLPPANLSNPGDFTPALLPAAPTSGAGAGAATAQLPLYGQIAADPGSDLPALHMDLHVYDPNPRKRFVMLNMQKLRQGDALANGVTVVKIRPDGVVLSYQGREFLLPR